MTLTSDEQDLLLATQNFAAAHVIPAASNWAKGAPVDPALLKMAADLGLNRVQIPVEAGGKGFGFVCKSRICEILAAADFGFAMSAVNSHNVAHKLAEFGTATVKQRFLPELLDGSASACTALTEPTTGSDFFAIRTRARKDGDSWILNGEKTWITNGRNAGCAIVYAQCGDQGDRQGIAAFVVDLRAKECQQYEIESSFSQISTGTGGFILSDYRATAAEMLLDPGDAFRSVLSELNGARTYVAAMCCGMLDMALQHSSVYGRQRESFGQTLVEHQAWRFALANAETDLAAARQLVLAAEDCVTNNEDAQLIAAQAKIIAVAACRRHIPELMHGMGAEGLREERPFGRYIAAAQIASLVDGSTEMLLERIAQLARPAVA